MLKFGRWSAWVLVALGSAQALIAADRVPASPSLTGLATEDRTEVSVVVEALLQEAARTDGKAHSKALLAAALAMYEGSWQAGAAMDSIFSHTCADLGDHRPTWRPYPAFRALAARLNKSRQTENLLSIASLDVRHMENLSPALRYREALLDLALHTVSPIDRIVTLRERAVLLHKIADRKKALLDCEKTWDTSPRFESYEQQQSIEIDNLLIQERILRSFGDTGSALWLLNEAYVLSHLGNNHHRLIEILQERAKIWLSLGQELEAEGDQEAGLVELERQRRTLRDNTLRVILADLGRSLLEERIALQLQRGESAEATLDTAERLRARSLLDVVGKSDALGWPEPRPAREIAASLPESTALVEYLWARGHLLAWVITHDEIDLVDLGLGRYWIETLANRFEGSLRNNHEDDADARELFRRLIAPLEPHLREASTLVISPDGGLCHVPFAALREESSGRFLIEKYALAETPSAEIYTTLAKLYRERSQSPPDSILLFGKPETDQHLFPTLTSLPAAEREIDILRREYSQPLVLTGPEATAERLLATLPYADVFHYAGHTVIPKGADAPSLLTTPSGVTWSTGGLLPAGDITLPRPLRTRVAVLAGCRTAEGHLSPNEGTLGLAHAFLTAGVPVVLASHWNTDDDSSSRLLLNFHARLLTGADPLTALRQAQLDLLRSSDRSLASPHTWAAFQAIGGAFVSP